MRQGMVTVVKKPYARWRAYSLVGIHLLFATHFIHWKIAGRTLAPLELNEVLYTLHQGIVTAGFILMAAVMVATLIFGRFFCSWGCHILALQDLSAWLLGRLGIRPRPLRSRTLTMIPMLVMFYMFIWPQLLSAFHGVPENSLRVVEAGTGGWSSFTTDDLWRNLPPVEVALLTFFICGGLIVYLMGNRGFCFNGCPYGALFGIADQFAPGRIALAGNCTQCGLCTAACTSDILVHREIAQHGMVTNPRCLKDLDCVAVCPENAISFGFRKPPVFRKGHPLGNYAGRYSFTLGEDAAMLGLFLVSVAVLRGLYDVIPLLLSVGLAICLAFFSVLVWRTITGRNIAVRSISLRKDGGWTAAGRLTAAFGFMLALFMAHSAVIQYHTFSGKRKFMQLAGVADGPTADPEILQKAIHHYERALGWGLMQPVDQRKELANLYLLDDRTERSVEKLTEVVNIDPANIGAHCRLAAILAETGDREGALRHWTLATTEGRVRPHTQDVHLLSVAHLRLGQHYDRAGDRAKAIERFTLAVATEPSHPEALLALGHFQFRHGNDAEALLNFEEALKHGGEHPMLHNNIGALHMRMGDPGKARPHLERLAVLLPDDARAHYSLSMMHLSAGRQSAAQLSLRKTLELDPGHENAAKALARILERNERRDPLAQDTDR